jgi:hypothetical protein
MAATEIKVGAKTIPLYFGMECAEMQLKAQLEGKAGDYSTNFQLIMFGHKNWATINDAPCIVTAAEINEHLELKMMEEDMDELNRIGTLWMDSISHKYIKKKVAKITDQIEKWTLESSSELLLDKSESHEKNIIHTPLPTSS